MKGWPMGEFAKKTSIAAFLVLFLPLTLSWLTACAPGVVGAPEELPPFSNNCQLCARWMEGSFTDANRDGSNGKTGTYWLHQARIWPSRSDGIWIYSEFVRDQATDSPLQQVVFRVNDNLAGGIVVKTYRLPGNPMRFLGDWRTPRMFNAIEPMNLKPQPGCRIDLKRDSSGALSGSGSGSECPSNLPGATYQQTGLTLGPMEIVLRLKGFDESGTQVFGTRSEGLTLERKNPSKAPISIKPGTGRAPDLGPYELEQADEDD